MFPFSGKYAVWSEWEEWSGCSQTCGGGQRERERDCEESPFPPRSNAATQRKIDSFGSLDLVPILAEDGTRTSPVRQAAYGGAVVDDALCHDGGKPTESSDCNKYDCPRKIEFKSLS